MKVYGYRAVQRGPRALEELMNRLAAAPLEQRNFDGVASGLRLETVSSYGDFVFADFAAKRGGHGPGRISPTSEIADIELAEGESFGEDTGLVYHPSSRYLAVQYNHHGPKLSRISDYLYAADLSYGGLREPGPGEVVGDYCGYRFGTVLRRDSAARLARMAIVKTLEFEVSVPGIDVADRDAGRSLIQAVTDPLPEGVETIKVTIQTSKDQGGRIERNGVMRIVDEVKNIGGALRGAMVRGKIAENSLTENIDLIEERLVADALVNAGRGLRYSRQDRWNALHRRLVTWLESGDMPQAR